MDNDSVPELITSDIKSEVKTEVKTEQEEILFPGFMKPEIKEENQEIVEGVPPCK